MTVILPPAVNPVPVSVEGSLIVTVVPVGVVRTSNFLSSKAAAVMEVPGDPGIVTPSSIIIMPASKLGALLKFKVAAVEPLLVSIVTPD